MKAEPAAPRIDGVLLLDKPAGITSNRALQQVRDLYDRIRGGHSGSLDPIATGLLPICLGGATRTTTWLLGSTKQYRTHIQFGLVTDSGDSSGTATARSDQRPQLPQLEAALNSFRGPIEQVPPMYSALKHKGQRLYTLARRGIEAPRQARSVTVELLDLVSFDGDEAVLDLRCSGGFYVRSLAYDLGQALGCGACVSALRRTAVGALSLEDAVTMDALSALPDLPTRQGLLIPPDAALGHLPQLHLSTPDATAITHGRSITPDPPIEPTAAIRLYSPTIGFLGIGTVTEGNCLLPKRLFPQRG